MAEIRWTHEAVAWMEKIHKYIAEDSPEAANHVLEGIYTKAQLLADFPEMGYHYRQEPNGSIRVLLYGHYRIAYLFRDPDIIEILGIFHGAMDITRYL